MRLSSPNMRLVEGRDEDCFPMRQLCPLTMDQTMKRSLNQQRGRTRGHHHQRSTRRPKRLSDLHSKFQRELQRTSA
jgi:hypothetical protein